MSRIQIDFSVKQPSCEKINYVHDPRLRLWARQACTCMEVQMARNRVGRNRLMATGEVQTTLVNPY